MPEWGLTTPEFELLKDLKWEATEKIDGTNMSYCYSYRQKLDGVSEDLEIHGKTDKAQYIFCLKCRNLSRLKSSEKCS